MSKWRLVVTALVLCGGMATLTLGQEAGANREADHQALRQLRKSFMTAITKHDVPTLMTFFAKEFVITSIDQVVITNKESFAAYCDLMFKAKDAPLAKMEIAAEADILTRFTGEDTGYCYGSALATYTLKDGNIIKIKERWTGLVQKEGGEWKLAAAHVGVNFLDNPVLRAKSMSFWRKMGIFLRLEKPPSD